MNPTNARILPATVLAMLTACSREPRPSPPPPTPHDTSASITTTPTVPAPLIATARGWALPTTDPQAGWHPTREAVSITPVADSPTSFDVSYTRDKGTASGAAFMLPPASTSDLTTLVITASASPDQRLFACLTDEQGIVWTFPTIRLTGTVTTIELPTSDVAPDPYQNAGKSPPPSPDWSTMKMLTILDISAHMGAPSVPCRWTIQRVEGMVR